jgi:hypothetical protein
MNEPISLRISDASDPHRGEKFSKLVERRRANVPAVMRGLMDAWIACDGNVDFPVELKSSKQKRQG